ncbi:serine/threonine-protein kinase [Streptomyces mexicanus]|uniref:serine/threonine-protein kinase n=1 Tax=Streptomyces mexicanus TaxID=178566 RepID=UPI003651C597
MADVYEGVDMRLRRAVAVKVFRPGSDPQVEDRLTAEAVLLARLQHPGLVTVYDSGRDDDRTYLVMQLIDGPTLRSVLACGALPERRVRDVGAALARALASVHGAGIVHRDVKPSNVLLDASGDPHLADFGIARLANSTRHTAPDALMGTAAYLAPEQVEGKRVGPAADVYALGLVLLECLKGELEYPGTPLEAAIARLHRPPAVPAWAPSDVADLLQAMTAQDPEGRPDAEQCANALASRLGAGTHALPLSVPSETRLPLLGNAHADADGHVRTQEMALTRRNLAGGVRHNRRLVVGTGLAALSVALGTALPVASGSGGNSDHGAEAAPPAATPAHPSSRTATPGRPDAVPPTGSPRTRPASRTFDATDPAVAATGFHAEPAVRTFTAPSPAATPTGPRPEPPSTSPSSSHGATAKPQPSTRQHSGKAHRPAPHRPRDTDDRTRHTAHGAPQPGPPS